MYTKAPRSLSNDWLLLPLPLLFSTISASPFCMCCLWAYRTLGMNRKRQCHVDIVLQVFSLRCVDTAGNRGLTVQDAAYCTMVPGLRQQGITKQQQQLMGRNVGVPGTVRSCTSARSACTCTCTCMVGGLGGDYGILTHARSWRLCRCVGVSVCRWVGEAPGPDSARLTFCGFGCLQRR